MTLASGSSLSHYSILGALGAGAMGEVYRARDTKLGREVAIKVLPEHFADDEERLKRFEREAKTLASLNHPNVAQIFGVDQVGDTCFLVLELVPGESLEERLKGGALPLDEALDVCRQIADGLEAAHEAGVIHRDLKPANVRLTPDGKVKVLDFGLAKPAHEGRHGSTTDSVLSTVAGRLLGTPTYMAPEQARGKAIDRRVDIWAFGCVLYECLTGERAFDGETLTDVLATVLHKELDVAQLSGVPPRVKELLARCLSKDPRRRLRDIGEARLVLEQPGGDVSAAPSRPSAASRWLPWAACALLAVTLALALLRERGTVPASATAAAPVRTAVRLPAGVRLDLETNIGETALLAISPDGTKLAFVASDGTVRKLFLRSLDAYDTLAVPDSEDAATPFFSPDSRWVAFTARGRLFKAPVTGGAPVDLCEAQVGRGGAWGADGTIVFPAGIASGLMRVSSSGGRADVLTELDASNKERTHRWPSFLPGGKEVVYTVGLGGKSGDYEDSDIDAVSLATGKKRHLGLHASFVRVTEGGLLLFARQGRISSVRIADLDGSRAPEPVVVLQGVAGVPTSGVAHFDVSQSGTLVYAEADPHAREGELAWVSRDGRVERLALPARGYSTPAVSPDGSKIAVTIGSALKAETDVWIHDLHLGSIANLSADGASSQPLWTPDGTRVTYLSAPSARTLLVTRSSDGRGKPEVVRECARGESEAPQSWTPDEKELVYLADSGPPNSADLFSWSVPDRQSRTILATTAIEYAGMLTPSGKWIALASIETGRSALWVQAFSDDGGRWQITESGAMPCWSRDGKELFYVDSENMMSVQVKTEPSFAAVPPVKLFSLEFPTSFNTARNWDVGPDGRFLVVLRTSKETLAGHIDVVQNWLGELR